MTYDVIVVGGGMAGLTAAAYCTRKGKRTLVCERQEQVGGHVNSFERNGFLFDQGIRSIESSGIVFPMFKQLGIDIDFIRSAVSLGVADKMIKVETQESLAEYGKLLEALFPENRSDIGAILAEIRRIMDYMDILYGIDNPLFLDTMTDLKYVRKTLLPWLFKYIRTMPKLAKLNEPVGTYLKKFTNNQALVDIIAQHFFKDTPTFFALSYFSLYLDYNYPRGGTRMIPKAMRTYVEQHGGEVRTGLTIESVDVNGHTVMDQYGETYTYRQLIWAADLRHLYRSIDYSTLKDPEVRSSLQKRRDLLDTLHGGDSIFTLYLAVDLPVEHFEQVSSAHLFYTPKTKGLSPVQSEAFPRDASDNPEHQKAAAKQYLGQYFANTTYEISFPAMRDRSLAPEGKTGIIISTLFDYRLTRIIDESGWYDECKTFCEDEMVKALSGSLYPGLDKAIIERFSSTPLTIERLTGNSEGAITGWAFDNPVMPVEHAMRRIAKSVETPLPDVQQAGQWTFSPSGLPISVVTGKLAAERALKRL